MCNYNFEILSPTEFENMTRDLLQAKLKIDFESFKDGRDGGIDFRYAESKGGDCIVQAKRYKLFKDLINELQREVKKVANFEKAPKRYLLSTSVDLSKDEKDKIFALFQPYIKKKADIIGRKDLNSLLRKNKEIENDYYKLWLASTNVLNRIVHNASCVWADIERKNIEREIKTYVKNDSFDEAIRILNEHHYIILSGMPGVGKTTLARMLIAQKLADGYKVLVSIRKSIEEGASMLYKGKKTIFFYDDFLGQSSLELNRTRNESKDIMDFINTISESSDKLFILTTREHVLRQAKAHDENIGQSDLDMAKCVVDMDSYNYPIRAEILRSHLSVSDIPQERIDQLFDEENFERVVYHQNYSPRIIVEYIRREWKRHPADQFVSAMIDMLDNPSLLWEYPFKELEKEQQYALLVLCTMGIEANERHWHIAFNTFCERTYSKLHLSCDDEGWRRGMKILCDSFIQISEPDSYGQTYVVLHNASINDYLLAYIKQHTDVQWNLAIGAHYIEQTYSIFSNQHELTQVINGYVYVEPIIENAIATRFIEILEAGAWSYTCSVKDNGNYDVRGMMTALSFFSTMHKDNGVLEHFLTKSLMLDPESPPRTRLSFLREICDYREVDFTPEEIVRAIIGEDMGLSDHEEWLRTVLYWKLKNVIDSKTYFAKLNRDIQRDILRQVKIELTHRALVLVIERIAVMVPDEKLFPANKYIKYIETLSCDKKEKKISPEERLLRAIFQTDVVISNNDD